ncbi:uncharacterized protein LOC111374895 [Olea europaea var. sylvestris]|uniref:FLZ-type domain-containing protein n=1 Tax=Olea europaea subsp. europaea TaxID=158383 RepID=A0A8S0SFV7_OLEEU|nr:uncharacterized protein LOC111374895 [Olea europaea var. sylvestris]CAA2990341.1 Hypothetical predicted protein [Olea europaea subsp. europaea]
MLSIEPNSGLRILIQLKNGESNVVFNTASKLINPSFYLNQTQPPSIHSCFLKLCFLCNKHLSLDKEVYMYRGDQGFCSVECRSRQIYIDEMKEIEISTKKVLASMRQRGSSGRCETSSVLEESRQRRRPFSTRTSRVVFS